jgi:hypothetical protein
MTMMMRKVGAVAVAAWAGICGAQAASTAGALEFEATIGGEQKAFAPKHVAAVWIEDDGGRFVRTILVRGLKQNKRLEAWRAASGGAMVDIVTGPTFTEWGKITATWDGKDAAGKLVPDGAYKLRAESTWWNGAGPRIDGVKFEKGPKVSKPEVPDAGAFRDIYVSWQPGGAP